jgi:hypothetical protein
MDGVKVILTGLLCLLLLWPLAIHDIKFKNLDAAMQFLFPLAIFSFALQMPLLFSAFTGGLLLLYFFKVLAFGDIVVLFLLPGYFGTVFVIQAIIFSFFLGTVFWFANKIILKKTIEKIPFLPLFFIAITMLFLYQNVFL